MKSSIFSKITLVLSMLVVVFGAYLLFSSWHKKCSITFFSIVLIGLGLLWLVCCILKICMKPSKTTQRTRKRRLSAMRRIR